MFILFSIIIILIFLWEAKFSTWNDDYVGKEQANAIKGFWILFLTVGHIIILVLLQNGLYDFAGNVGNRLELSFHQRLNQLVVVMFLFFSGYGVSEGIKKSIASGGGYIRSIPRRRILKTYLNFLVGLLIYVLLSPLTGNVIEWRDLPQYLVLWKSIGSPTWYIFVILLCYLASWLSARQFGISRVKMVITHTVIIAVIAYALSLVKQEWWYDTIFSYVFGFAFSQYKIEAERFIKKHYFLSLGITLLILGALYYITRNTTLTWIVSFNLLSMSFAMLNVIVGMKVKVGNKVINWCGEHLFPIYMYQGLFYQMLFNIGGDKHTFAAWSPFLFTLASIALTLLLAKFYHLWDIKIK